MWVGDGWCYSDRPHPIEPGAKVDFHLLHQIARGGGDRELDAVLGRHDEAKRWRSARPRIR